VGNHGTDTGTTTEATENAEWVKPGVRPVPSVVSVPSVVLLCRFQGGVGLQIEIRVFPSLYLASCLSPYLSSYPASCRSAYPDLYLDLRLRLNLNLNLNLNLVLYPTSNRALFLELPSKDVEKGKGGV
jgi:hypothetical protein